MGLLRLLLAMAVVVVHTKPLFGVRATRMTGGIDAVRMFYTISGFYMALILCRKYTGAGSYRTFLANRFLRLYPAYIVVVVLTVLWAAAVHWDGGSMWPLRAWRRHGGSFSLMTVAALVVMNLVLIGENLAVFLCVRPESGQLGFTADFTSEAMPAWWFMAVPQAWTLGVEFLFYLIAPLLVRRRAAVVAAVLVASAALRWWTWDGLGLKPDPWQHRFFPTELPFFLLGVLAYKVYDALEGTRWLGRSLGLPLFLITLAMVLGYRYLPAYRGHMGMPYTCFAFAVALPWIFALTRENKLDRWVGELSYAVYICHWFVAQALRQAKAGWIDQHYGVLTCALAIGLAILLERIVERPIDRWRQELSRRAQGPKVAEPIAVAK